jgi:hypothetical protein
VNLNERTITIRRSVFEGAENTSKSDTGDEDRSRTVPIDASVAMELKKNLRGRRSGYLFDTRNGTPLRLSNVLEDEGQASSHLEKAEAAPTRHRDARFSERADFSPCLFRGGPSGHSRLVRTFFGQNDRPLHEDVAPAPCARNGESEAVESKLDPTGRRESGTLVHRVVK